MTHVSFNKIIAVTIGAEEYGISMEQVISIERLQAITNVPQTSEYIRGILELRGQVIPVVDLRRYLLNNQVKDLDSNRIVIVKVQNSLVGLIVDEATDIIDVSEDAIEDVPLTGLKMENTMNVAKVGDRLIVLMDINVLLANTDISEAIRNVNKSL